MAIAGTPKYVSFGTGSLYLGTVGSTEPDATTAAGTAWSTWTPLGFTEEGSTFTISPSFEPIMVAESLTPIGYARTGIEYTLELALAESTVQNLKIVLNGGTITTTGTGATTMHKFEPLADDAGITYTAIGWDGINKQNGLKERWIYRQAFQSDDVEIGRRKDEMTTMSATFTLVQPASGVTPFAAYQLNPTV